MLQNPQFYTINFDYLEYLHSIDSEVYFNPNYRSNTKPFVGIVLTQSGFNYFIPLTSAKPKHARLKNVARGHYLIYEIINSSKDSSSLICKPSSGNKRLHILSLLDLKKMIPVPEGLFYRLDFNTIQDIFYRRLLEKEYQFCLKIFSRIEASAHKLYEHQKATGTIGYAQCNFAKLEKALGHFIQENAN